MSAFQQPELLSVHPLVMLSVQDHHRRAQQQQQQHQDTKARVVGALLGHVSPTGRHLSITNSFAVPFSEDDTTATGDSNHLEGDPPVWFLDHDYLSAMRDLFRKVNVKERVVGWYHTGGSVRASDPKIHRVFAQVCGQSGDCGHPVMVVFDAGRDCAFDGYIMATTSGNGNGNGNAGMTHVKGTMAAEEAEEVGVEHLLRDVADTAAGSLSRGLAVAVKELMAARDGTAEIIDYLEGVLSGRLSGQQETLVRLHRLLSTHLVNQATTVQSSCVDEQVRLFVGQLARAVLSLHDLIENKETEAAAIVSR